jgi:4-oxalocrotonate tautomerase
MPLIQVQVIKDVFSQEQKRQSISKLTDAMVSIEGENMRQVTLCLVEEVESGDWGIGGKALTTADVHALARGKAAWRRELARATPAIAAGVSRHDGHADDDRLDEPRKSMLRRHPLSFVGGLILLAVLLPAGYLFR